MELLSDSHLKTEQGVRPLCPVFGQCGGCAYQDRAYEEELFYKEAQIRDLFHKRLNLSPDLVESIVPSPKPYHYRHRLDLTLKRTNQGEILLGFQVEGKRKIIEVDSCVISEQVISDFIPQLKKEAVQKLSDKYWAANLVVKTGEDHRVVWGGIGRRSLVLPDSKYLWTEVHGKRIFYSLDTFFQANLSILPLLVRKMKSMIDWDKRVLFLDLYAGVGLFGVYFSHLAGKVVMVENTPSSVEVMKFNIRHHHLTHAQVCEGEVAAVIEGLLSQKEFSRSVAMVDPPRKGLDERTRQMLVRSHALESLFYLSCNPESLARDLEEFCQEGWSISKVVPFDFFPKTKHIETLVLLNPWRKQE